MDGVLLPFRSSDHGIGSRWWESRSQPPLGCRMVSLEMPSPGGRNPDRYRQIWNETSGEEAKGGCYVCSCSLFVLKDLASWMELLDRYKVFWVSRLWQYGCLRFRSVSLVWKKNGSDGSVVLRKKVVWFRDGILGWRKWRTKAGSKVNLGLRGWNLELYQFKGNCRLILWETDWKIRKGEVGTRERGILKDEIRVDGKGRFGFLAPRRGQRWPEMVESISRKNRGEFSRKKMITCGGREKAATRASVELYEGTWKGCRRQGYILGKGGTFSGYVIQAQYFGRNGDGTRVATKRRLESINHSKMMSLGIGEAGSTTFLNYRTVMWVATNGVQVLAQIYFKEMIYSGTQWELINEISEVFMLIMHGLHEVTIFYPWVHANQLYRKEKGVVGKKKDWGNHSVNKQTSYSTMADEVEGLMGNLNFSEEELVDINNIGEEMVETMEGSEKWAVDQNLGKERKEGSGDHMLEGQNEEGRILQQKGKDKMVGTSAKMRTMKRTLKGKNEVCNPIAAKKSRTTSNLLGEEDACSEATSPIKNSAPTVEAGSQPRRES
ncbi:hypothetical protein V6N11_056296 [Hibiscus sabdariffa]|uniref:DUF4283 domain-containing protein n=1 Tax=Hibiscus sabdariffa TaxID=183260 RepID=A0ABR2T3E3_9ROSI